MGKQRKKGWVRGCQRKSVHGEIRWERLLSGARGGEEDAGLRSAELAVL